MGRLIVISTIRAADELNDNRAPEEAKLFVYDVSEQKIVREIVPVAKGRTTGLIAEVAPGRLLGLTSNPEQSGRSILYGVDVTTGEVLFTKDLPSPVSIGRLLAALGGPVLRVQRLRARPRWIRVDVPEGRAGAH